MLFVDSSPHTDPRINLAVEEHLLRNIQVQEPILLFYVNEPSVIIGRNQNTLEEIDPDYVKAKGIHVVRRLSGGGAVYHDLGNLNFSFITQGSEDLHNFAKFTEPVIKVLGELGVGAELRGRSDIFATGRKISGNAQYVTANRMFSHGTLLFDTDLEEMLKALNPRQIEIESRAVQSIRNYVANIRDLALKDMDLQGLKAALLKGIFGSGDFPSYELNDEEWAAIHQLSAKRYQQWDWNYGHSPRFNIQKSDQTPAGKIDVGIDVDKGRIRAIKFFGDFSGRLPVSGLEELLLGIRYNGDEITATLEAVDVGDYFDQLDRNTLSSLLY